MKIADNIRWFAAQDGAVLLNPTASKYYHLNECGTAIWRGIAEGKSHSEIVETLKSKYETTTEQLTKDLDAFYDNLTALGFLASEVAESGSAST